MNDDISQNLSTSSSLTSVSALILSTPHTTANLSTPIPSSSSIKPPIFDKKELSLGEGTHSDFIDVETFAATYANGNTLVRNLNKKFLGRLAVKDPLAVLIDEYRQFLDVKDYIHVVSARILVDTHITHTNKGIQMT